MIDLDRQVRTVQGHVMGSMGVLSSRDPRRWHNSMQSIHPDYPTQARSIDRARYTSTPPTTPTLTFPQGAKTKANTKNNTNPLELLLNLPTKGAGVDTPDLANRHDEKKNATR